MAIRIFVALLAFATARGEGIEAAMAVDDICTAGGDCSLELHQPRYEGRLRGSDPRRD